jgi:hypothetical protein
VSKKVPKKGTLADTREEAGFFGRCPNEEKPSAICFCVKSQVWLTVFGVAIIARQFRGVTTSRQRQGMRAGSRIDT